MMGGKTPDTCCAVNKRQDNNLKNSCIRLVIYKLLIYKTILKPIWTKGIPLWGTASNSKVEILQRFQNKVLRSIVNAPRYVPNTILHSDLQIPTVKAEIPNFNTKYQEKLITHPNKLTPALLEEEEPRRLKRFEPTELTTRFL